MKSHENLMRALTLFTYIILPICYLLRNCILKARKLLKHNKKMREMKGGDARLYNGTKM